MLFQQSNSTPCIKEQLEEEGHRWWWRMRHRCEEHEALIVTTEVEWSRLSWSYSVAQGKQLLPLTQTHTHTHTRNTDLINSPGKGAASEQASVTHSSKNKLGSCENKAWEPWNLGAVEGWDLQLYAEQRGRSRTSSGGQGNTEWQVLRQRVGGRVYSQSGPSTLEQRTQCACPACCVSYYKPRPGGLKPAWDRSYQEIVKKKKNCHCFFSIFISTVTWMPQAREFMSAYNCISTTPKAASQLPKRMQSLIWESNMGVHLMPGVLLTLCHLVFNLNPG